jgi:hypothetical protein
LVPWTFAVATPSLDTFRVDGDAIMGADALRFGQRVFHRDPPLAEWDMLGWQVMNLWGSADLCENANT